MDIKLVIGLIVIIALVIWDARTKLKRRREEENQVDVPEMRLIYVSYASDIKHMKYAGVIYSE
jgi:hypothetical protein